MKSAQIRTAFLEYFQSHGHEVVASSSLVPHADPTILFTNAGMNQFKGCFLGSEKRSYNRAATAQKCLRISGKHNDLENVGRTARHHTFFEMMGNFSFGDYFKSDAIKFAWELVTGVLKLDKNRLWVTVYEEDEEAADLWATLTDVKKERILRYGKDSNFWAMGDTGPCGPCSEIFYYNGDDASNQSEAEFRKDDGTYMEIWNLVFMQFDRQPDGSYAPLPKPSIDTGAGLERLSAVVQGKKANYDTDILRGIITKAEELSGFKYDGRSYEPRDLKSDKQYERDVAMRVIADHSRAIAFLVADGVSPSSDGRGYVLRRLIRRAVRHGRALGFSTPFLWKTADTVVDLMSDEYPDLTEHRSYIHKVVEAEETKFHETLDAGLTLLHSEREKLKRGDKFSGQVAFLLHDTYGFPLDLTQDVLKAYNLEVDESGFEAAMQKQRERSREDRAQRGHVFEGLRLEGAKTEFAGYEQAELEADIQQIIRDEKDPKRFLLLFGRTPFYAESGGQVGDTGTIETKSAKLRVLDTQKVQQDYILHYCELTDGDLVAAEKQQAFLRIDKERRDMIRANHSATHLFHSALRRVLGVHVKQAGSRVDERSLRFDYSHFAPVTESQLREIQALVNHEIRENYVVETVISSVDEAKKAGAIALFGEKYGDKVRVVKIGPQSMELCGGTHVARSGDIGFAVVAAESGISAGVRRIECLTGIGAESEWWSRNNERLATAEVLKSDPTDIAGKVEKLMLRLKAMESENESLRAKLASSASHSLIQQARVSPKGIKVIAERIENADIETLRSMVDELRVKLQSGVVALASKQGESLLFVAGVTEDLTSSVNAGNLVKEAAKITGGRGGGRADFGQAGGGDPSKVGAALNRVYELVA